MFTQTTDRYNIDNVYTNNDNVVHKQQTGIILIMFTQTTDTNNRQV